jgi:hypothetical protein
MRDHASERVLIVARKGIALEIATAIEVEIESGIDLVITARIVDVGRYLPMPNS